MENRLLHYREAGPRYRGPENSEISEHDEAKAEIDAAVAKSIGTDVGTTRSNVAKVAENFDGEGKAVVSKYLHEFDGATVGHNGVGVEALGGSIKGVNYHVGTHNTAVDNRLVSADAVLNNADNLAETLDHEDETTTGHAGQRDDVQSVVDAKGNEVSTTVQLEGNVEDHQTKKHGQRSDQPRAIYGEGEDFAKEVGANKLDQYVRKSGHGDRAKFQAEIFSESSLTEEQMEASLEDANFTSKEIEEVRSQTRGKFENGPNYEKEQAKQPVGATAA